MSTTTRILSIGVAVGFLLAVISGAVPSPARAAWVNNGQFQVGGKLAEIVPTLVSTAPGIANSPALVNPTCGSQGGTSLALVRGSKLAGVDPVLYPIALVVSCLDNGGSATVRSRLNFINPITLTGVVNGGVVVKQLSTVIASVVAAPSNGWAHLVHRPDKGDLLGCGADGSLYSIDYKTTTATATATTLSTPALGSCGGLAWDAENDWIFQGVAGATGNKIGSVARFTEVAVTPEASFTTSLACPANGLAISGGVVLVSCAGLVNNTLVIQRIDKTTGLNLGLYSSISLPAPGSPLGLTALNSDPGLGDLACDPVSFQRAAPDPNDTINPLGRDLYRDAVWSRRGANGNGVAAVEFPAFTCGLPSSSVQNGFSPLAAGLSMPDPSIPNGPPGQVPRPECFENGIVKDSDGDGLPDCWETSGGINFAGDGVLSNVYALCAPGDTNADGVPECADPQRKDLFVEVNWMVNHQPDRLALSQTQAASSVGVQSVRGAFAAAPVKNPNNNPDGIRLHFQVKDAPVRLNTLADPAGAAPTQTHVTELVFTPCTPPATNPNGTLNVKSLSDAADFDAIKALNFGTTTERQNVNVLNAKRLAVRYVLFGHNQTGSNQAGSSSSGCAEVGGDDATITMGSFTSITVSPCTAPGCTSATHNRGLTDQQAGTFMHEFGHLLGFQHGGEDTVNNKPNYRSVMSYNRQFSGSPIAGRRLDYSRSEVDLDESNLIECSGIGSDPTLGPIGSFFPSADQIAFGPGGQSVATPWPPLTTTTDACNPGPAPINWNRQTIKGKIFQPTTGDINGDGVVGSGVAARLFGSNDWANLLYRFSAAIDFAGGSRSETPFAPGSSEMTKEDETNFFLAGDKDGNGVGDAQDCGTVQVGTTAAPLSPGATTVPVTFDLTFDPSRLAATGTGYLGSNLPLDAFAYTGAGSNGFTGVIGVLDMDNPPPAGWPTGTRVLAPVLCPLYQCGIKPNGQPNVCHTHRIDIKPSAPLPKTINLGTEANVTIAIFSEVNWNAPAEIKVDKASLALCPMTFTVDPVVEPVKTNNNGSGTCSVSDVEDPATGLKDGVKDLKCQFPTTGLPAGTHWGVVSGCFIDPLTGQSTAFSARQEVTILP